MPIKQIGRKHEGLWAGGQLADAKAVLATLWPVADESTAVLMQRFHALSAKNENKTPPIGRYIPDSHHLKVKIDELVAAIKKIKSKTTLSHNFQLLYRPNA